MGTSSKQKTITGIGRVHRRIPPRMQDITLPLMISLGPVLRKQLESTGPLIPITSPEDILSRACVSGLMTLWRAEDSG